MLFAIEKEFASLDGRLVERVAVTRLQSHYRPASWWLRIRSREDGIRNRRYGNFREAAPAASGRSDERRREPHHQRDQRRHDGAGRRPEHCRTDHDDHYRWRESGYGELLTAAFMSAWARWLQVFSGKTQGPRGLTRCWRMSSRSLREPGLPTVGRRAAGGAPGDSDRHGGSIGSVGGGSGGGGTVTVKFTVRDVPPPGEGVITLARTVRAMARSAAVITARS
jgi:hypothetical protein